MNHEIVVTPLMALHLFAGVGALALGIFQVFFMPRGGREHKKLGWYWAILMFSLAASSLWDLIGDGLLSIPAHAFTLATFIFLPMAIWAARNKKIKLHKTLMFVLFGVLVAAFAALVLAPGRLINMWFFGA